MKILNPSLDAQSLRVALVVSRFNHLHFLRRAIVYPGHFWRVPGENSFPNNGPASLRGGRGIGQGTGLNLTSIHMDFSYTPLKIESPSLEMEYFLVPWDSEILGRTVAQIRKLRIKNAVGTEQAVRGFQEWLEKEEITLPVLRERLEKRKVSGRLQPILLQGHKEVYYGKVIEVMDLIKELEIEKLGLILKPKQR